jgi:hypothetical protein
LIRETPVIGAGRWRAPARHTKPQVRAVTHKINSRKGHESTDATQIYLHADMSIKERALARTTPTSTGTLPRYQPPDALLVFLDEL